MASVVSAKLRVLVLVIATSCVMSLRGAESIRVENLVKQEEQATSTGSSCYGLTSSEAKACPLGCSYIPTSGPDGVCMPAQALSDNITECTSHGDCSKVDPDSYCIRLIDAPYGLCSRPLKF